MNRIVLSLTSLVALGGVACDKSAADAQERADKAQAKANTEINSAEVNAAEKANRAQAEADKKIAQAREDFRQTSEDYRHDMQANLDSLDKRLADFDAKATSAADAKRADLLSKSASLHAQRDAFANDFGRLSYETALTWDATKGRLDKEWKDLRASVNEAM
jgi:F0F1-type ATP synthase membrane subunit b/b'